MAIKVASKPSVTEILAGCGLAPRPERLTPQLEWALALGREIHYATALYDLGVDIDEEALSPDARIALEAFRVFRESDATASGWKVAAIETQLEGDYARGACDRIYESDGRTFLLDLKTGRPHGWHRVQTAAYATLYKPDDHQRIIRGALYWQPEKGIWHLRHHSDEVDFVVWSSAVNLYYFRKSKGDFIKPLGVWKWTSITK